MQCAKCEQSQFKRTKQQRNCCGCCHRNNVAADRERFARRVDQVFVTLSLTLTSSKKLVHGTIETCRMKLFDCFTLWRISTQKISSPRLCLLGITSCANVLRCCVCALKVPEKIIRASESSRESSVSMASLPTWIWHMVSYSDQILFGEFILRDVNKELRVHRKGSAFCPTRME